MHQGGMSRWERVFHAVSFEAVALLCIVPAGALLSNQHASHLALIGVGLSLFTVVWNVVYNLLFDRIMRDDRRYRAARVRVLHAVGFEGSLVVVTVPVLSWVLQISLMQALVVEAGFLLFFFVYTIVFNWLYDRYQPYHRWFASSGG